MLPVRRDRCASAFTLIELLTVIAIIAILSAITLGGIKGAKNRAAIARAKTELAALAGALEDYKRHYGDYPQTGASQPATAAVAARINVAQAQAILFNALTGVYGPTNFTTRLNGPALVDIAKFQLEDPTLLTSASFGVPTGSPPQKNPVANSFLDPWGNRYLYYYKAAGPPGRPAPAGWRAPAYVLYSAGPDGAQVAPAARTGLYSAPAQTSGTNADNLYSDQLP